MTIALPKGDFLVTAGFVAITGAGVALGFTVLDSTTSTWLLILAAATLGAPVFAGWLSPGLKQAWFFPIGVLASLSVATAIYGPLSSDSEPIGFVIVLTLIYGGAASVAFCVAWIARQYLRRWRGHRMPVSHLAIASLVAVCCSIALIVLFIAIPLASLTSTRAPYWSAILAPIGLIGVAAGSAIIWSDRNRGALGLRGTGTVLAVPGGIPCPAGILGNCTPVWPGRAGPRRACDMERCPMAKDTCWVIHSR